MNLSRGLFAALLSLCLLASPSRSQGGGVLERLRADLLAGASATQVLTQYCGNLRLAFPPVIRAMRDPVVIPAPADVRAALQAGPEDTVRHRRVRLTCGDHVLSNADNWYLPSRLTPEMNRQLEETETPFGTVVRPLDFHRRTLETSMGGGRDTILRIRAVLLTPTNAPFSLVIENYSPQLVAGPR